MRTPCGSSAGDDTGGFKLDSGPTVADGNVFVSAHPCYLYAFAVDTGALRWQYKLQLNGVTCDPTPTGPGVGHSTPTVAHGMVFVPYGGAVWALNDQTGAFLWHTTQANYTEVTYADGRLYTTDGVMSMRSIWPRAAYCGRGRVASARRLRAIRRSRWIKGASGWSMRLAC